MIFFKGTTESFKALSPRWISPELSSQGSKLTTCFYVGLGFFPIFDAVNLLLL